MSAEPDLAAPVKVALRWAWAYANARSASEVDPLDLLAGIMLADLEDSPPRRLFEHFGVSPRKVLRRPSELPPDERALLAALHQLPRSDMPPMHGSVAKVFARPKGQVTLRTLFGALLEEPSIAGRIGDVIGGQDPLLAYQKYLSGRQTYQNFLNRNFPRRPVIVELPDYLADQPRPRTEEPEDLVGVGAEVDAFARLIASRQLVPPLAIGLFGDWGSGKSYFLRAVQRRIDGIAEAPQQKSFHRSVVQIEFNAWQYVGGDLWAGLVEHLFRNLRVSAADPENLLEARQEYWIRQVQGATEEHERALAAKSTLEGERDDAAKEVEHREKERDQQRSELEETRQRNPLEGVRLDEDTVAKLKETFGLTELSDNAETLTKELAQTREDLRGLGAVLGPLRTTSWRYKAAVAGLVALPVLLAFLAKVVDPALLPSGTIVGVLTTITGYLTVVGRYTRSATDKITKAQEQIAAKEQEKRDELDAAVSEAEEKLAEVQTELDTAQETERELAERVAEVTEALAQVTPARVLDDFITERLDSDDYRRHLGVPALVRRDLERLSRLVGKEHDGEFAIDRIVLYIDDLDRCPTPLVIKVLEAVHLLLAFELFVVVVAVDARWLETSLKEHYTQLAGEGATPEDYLEKIFQVPFWVRPMDTGIRERMLRGLLTPSLVAPEAGEAGGDDPLPDIAEGDLQAFRQVVASFRATGTERGPWTDAHALTVTADEIRQIEGVADLIGATPRAVKRFVNVYLLVRSMGTARGWPLPPDGGLVKLLAGQGDTGAGDWADLVDRFRFRRNSAPPTTV